MHGRVWALISAFPRSLSLQQPPGSLHPGTGDRTVRAQGRRLGLSTGFCLLLSKFLVRRDNICPPPPPPGLIIMSYTDVAELSLPLDSHYVIHCIIPTHKTEGSLSRIHSTLYIFGTFFSPPRPRFASVHSECNSRDDISHDTSFPAAPCSAAPCVPCN